MTTGRINQVAAFELSIETTEPSDRVPELSPGPPFFSAIVRGPPDHPASPEGSRATERTTPSLPSHQSLPPRQMRDRSGRMPLEAHAFSHRRETVRSPSRPDPVRGPTVPATDIFYLIELLIEYRYKLHRPHASPWKAIARVCDPPTYRILLSELLSNQPSRLSPIPAPTCHRRVPSRHTPFLIDPRPDLPSTESAHAHQR